MHAYIFISLMGSLSNWERELSQLAVTQMYLYQLGPGDCVLDPTGSHECTPCLGPFQMLCYLDWDQRISIFLKLLCWYVCDCGWEPQPIDYQMELTPHQRQTRMKARIPWLTSAPSRNTLLPTTGAELDKRSLPLSGSLCFHLALLEHLSHSLTSLLAPGMYRSLPWVCGPRGRPWAI